MRHFIFGFILFQYKVASFNPTNPGSHLVCKFELIVSFWTNRPLFFFYIFDLVLNTNVRAHPRCLRVNIKEGSKREIMKLEEYYSILRTF